MPLQGDQHSGDHTRSRRTLERMAETLQRQALLFLDRWQRETQLTGDLLEGLRWSAIETEAQGKQPSLSSGEALQQPKKLLLDVAMRM
jgi:hypothetical protein